MISGQWVQVGLRKKMPKKEFVQFIIEAGLMLLLTLILLIRM